MRPSDYMDGGIRRVKSSQEFRSGKLDKWWCQEERGKGLRRRHLG